jgi:hypothetical protein
VSLHDRGVFGPHRLRRFNRAETRFVSIGSSIDGAQLFFFSFLA